MITDREAVKQARLRELFIHYLLGWGAWLASMLVAYVLFTIAHWFGAKGAIFSLLPWLAYLGVGFALTKYCLPLYIDFHPVWKTIDNLVGVRLRGIFLWPLFYLVLLFKLGFLHVMR